MTLHRILFTTALTCTSRVVQMRDHLLGRVPRSRPECETVRATQQTIRSGKNLLDGVYVGPASSLPRAAMLICHGIGEVVAQWFPVQRIFAENGIASLAFDYSGYGRSTGFIDWLQCERDAVASFHAVEDLAPGVPISLLGFSLGSGVAPAILNRVTPDRLILCAGYTSFRHAARAAWIPGFLGPIVPPIWSAEEALQNRNLPILIVQGDHDRLFNMRMAQKLVACCGGRAELLVLPARSHNYPVYHPQANYWSPIMQWVLTPRAELTRPG
jgi:uncharacterized protein